MNRHSVISVLNDLSSSFEDKALALYKYQYRYNETYRQFVDLVKYNGFTPRNVREIPHLPIALFKSNVIKTGEWTEELIFYSSGTTGMARSQHYVKNVKEYLQNAAVIWNQSFGDLSNFTFLSLLPNYHENQSSSLLCMVRHFMLMGAENKEAYYINSYGDLRADLVRLNEQGRKTVLFGVSFALMDYVDSFQDQYSGDLIVVETGGMKKHRKEITRSALHTHLRKGFRGAHIVSEYGMTECMSQMYCTSDMLFDPNERMAIFLTDPTDPGMVMGANQRGRINITDLGNVDTVAFIATDDLGVINDHGQVEIVGRIDYSDLRGCNYLI